MTHFERIKAMNAKQFADWLTKRLDCEGCPMFNRCRDSDLELLPCDEVVEKWLESEAEK